MRAPPLLVYWRHQKCNYYTVLQSCAEYGVNRYSLLNLGTTLLIRLPLLLGEHLELKSEQRLKLVVLKFSCHFGKHTTDEHWVLKLTQRIKKASFSLLLIFFTYFENNLCFWSICRRGNSLIDTLFRRIISVLLLLKDEADATYEGRIGWESAN